MSPLLWVLGAGRTLLREKGGPLGSGTQTGFSPAPECESPHKPLTLSGSDAPNQQDGVAVVESL